MIFGHLVPLRPLALWLPAVPGRAAPRSSGVWYPPMTDAACVTPRIGSVSKKTYPRAHGTQRSGDQYPFVRVDGTRLIRAHGTPLNR